MRAKVCGAGRWSPPPSLMPKAAVQYWKLRVPIFLDVLPPRGGCHTALSFPMRRVPEGSHQTPQQGVAHNTYALFVCPEGIPDPSCNMSPYVPPRQTTLLPAPVQLWEVTLGQYDVYPHHGRMDGHNHHQGFPELSGPGRTHSFPLET